MKVPVLVPKIFNFPFTYESGSIKNLKLGDLVLVPFGKNEEVGVVWNKIQPSNKDFKIKKIKQKIHNFKINQNLINFINWFSAYNLASKGMVLKMCLGDKKNAIKIEEHKREKLNKKTKFVLNKDQKKALQHLEDLAMNLKYLYYKVLQVQEKL